MATTFTKIQRVSLTSGNASAMSFTSIPQTYDDLFLKISARTDRSGYNVDSMTLTINGGTTSSYGIRAEGTGSTTGVYTGFFLCGAATDNTSANIFGNSQAYISLYTTTGTKGVINWAVSEASATGNNSAWQNMLSGVCKMNTPITSITLSPGSGTVFKQYSSATLYGIKRG